MESKNIFKKCPCCFHAWQTRDDFISDTNLKINGYQVNFKNLEYGMFFFTHTVEQCHSTLTSMVEDFYDLYTGEHYKGSKALSEECPRYCTDEKQLSRCDALCECAFAREIIQIIKERQKTSKLINQTEDVSLQS